MLAVIVSCLISGCTNDQIDVDRACTIALAEEVCGDRGLKYTEYNLTFDVSDDMDSTKELCEMKCGSTKPDELGSQKANDASEDT